MTQGEEYSSPFCTGSTCNRNKWRLYTHSFCATHMTTDHLQKLEPISSPNTPYLHSRCFPKAPIPNMLRFNSIHRAQRKHSGNELGMSLLADAPGAAAGNIPDVICQGRSSSAAHGYWRPNPAYNMRVTYYLNGKAQVQLRA